MRVFVFLLSIIIWSCNPTESNIQEDRVALDRQLEEIKTFITEGNCNENDSCQVIAVGSKACGGPKTYLVYSSTIEVETLKNKVEAYNQAETEFNEKYDIVSDCTLVTPPKNISCKDRNCVILEE